MRTGVNELARQTGYNRGHVSKMLKKGMSEAQIRDRAKRRGTGKNTRATAGHAMIAATPRTTSVTEVGSGTVETELKV